MNRTTFILIILICGLLLGVGIFWYTNNLNQIKPSATNPIDNHDSVNVDGIKKYTAIDIEKILDEIPFREIKTTKQEYEAMGWNRYENKEIGFEIYYPGDWRVSESKAFDTSDEPIFMSISFAPKTLLFSDSAFGLYIHKEPLKKRLLTLANRELLPVEKLRINNIDAVVLGRYSEEDKRAYGNVIFGSNNWTISFGGEIEYPSVYERMLKSFRLLSEK